MISLTVPKIFFNVWFWMAIIAVVAVIHYFWGKTPPPPRKPGKFYLKHKKTITKITDVFIILFILVSCLLLMSFPVIRIFDALFKSPQPSRAIDLHFAWAYLFIKMIICSGFSAMFIGMLSIFQSNLTKVKRLILFIICLLPMVFTIITLLIETTEEPWSTVRLGLIFSCNGWVINGPAIILGKHFFPVSWSIIRKLRLVSGDYPG